MKSPQASVRQCATRVFKLLGGDTLPETAQETAGSAAAAAAVPDLMTDLLGEEDTPAAAPASQDLLGMVSVPLPGLSTVSSAPSHLLVMYTALPACTVMHHNTSWDVRFCQCCSRCGTAVCYVAWASGLFAGLQYAGWNDTV